MLFGDKTKRRKEGNVVSIGDRKNPYRSWA
jgi:hypothetical protein